MIETEDRRSFRMVDDTDRKQTIFPWGSMIETEGRRSFLRVDGRDGRHDLSLGSMVETEDRRPFLRVDDRNKEQKIVPHGPWQRQKTNSRSSGSVT